MKSTRPKVVHEVGGDPMLAHVVSLAVQMKPQNIVIVVPKNMIYSKKL